MTWQRYAPVFDGARVQEVHQQPLTFANADRVARPERLVVDRVGERADLEAVRVCIRRGRLFKERAMMGVVVFVVHGCRKKRLPIAKREKEPLVVLARVVAITDVDKS